jgi:hypothetical protein
MSESIPIELCDIIAQSIDDAKTWKSWRLTCVAFAAMRHIHADQLLKLSNPIGTLLMHRPYTNQIITYNPWIRAYHVLKYPKVNWDWKYLAGRMQFDHSMLLDMLENDCELFVYMDQLSCNVNLPFSFVLSHLHLGWNWKYLTYSVDMYHIISCPELAWDWPNLGYNVTLTIDVVVKTMSARVWCKNQLCYNTTVTPEFYVDHMMHSNNLDIDALSENPAFTKQFIDADPEQNWNLLLAAHSQDAIAIFKAGHNISMSCISHHPDISTAVVLQYKDKHWDMLNLAHNIKPIKPGKLLSEIDEMNMPDWSYLNTLTNPWLTDSEVVDLLSRCERLNAESIYPKHKSIPGTDWYEREALADYAMSMIVKPEILTKCGYPILSTVSSNPNLLWTHIIGNDGVLQKIDWDDFKLYKNSFRRYNMKSHNHRIHISDDIIEQFIAKCKTCKY